MFLTSCQTKPWYYTKPFYCLNFVNQRMVDENGNKAPDQKQYCFKTKPEEIEAITDLDNPGYYNVMGDVVGDYGYWHLDGPYPPLETLEFIAYHKWLRGK